MITTCDVSPLQDDWFFNIGATHYLTNNSQSLQDVKPYLGYDQVTIRNGQSLLIRHFSNKLFFTSSRQFQLQQVLHVPNLSTNLINVYKFCSNDLVFFEFHSSCFLVKDQVTKQILLYGTIKDGLYTVSSLSTFLCACCN